MSFLSAITAPVASVIGGGLSFLGGERANEARAEAAAAANAASAASAERQMQFQKEMSGSAYQRAVADLKAAGINPMLAAIRGGATTPGGAMYTAQMPQVSDVMTPAVQSAIGAGVSSAQVAKMEAETGLTYEQQKNVNASTDKIREEIKNIPIEGEKLKQMVFLVARQAELYNLQGYTEMERQKMVFATFQKLVAEEELIRFDIAAAKTLDNLGREATQLKPIVDMLKALLLSARR